MDGWMDLQMWGVGVVCQALAGALWARGRGPKQWQTWAFLSEGSLLPSS